MNMNSIVKVNAENPVFCTMSVETRADKVALYNAVQTPTAKVSDFINKEIKFVNVHMEQCTFIDEDTGEVTDGIKTVLITPEGNGILAHSNGIAKSVMAILSMFGMPDEWEGEPMTVIVRQLETKNGRYFQLEVK